MNKGVRYELISNIIGHVILLMMLILSVGGMIVAIAGDKSVILDNFTFIVIYLCSMGFLCIPLAVYAEKGFKLEVENVRKMNDDEINEWINKTDGREVGRILNKIGGYKQKWVNTKEGNKDAIN
jgi:hypothetical protein